ncbi:MAG TPA: S46 family peptidase [Bacteroidales bacterium]|nr:S46 family peptidase [Bacteroidales bacterium]
MKKVHFIIVLLFLTISFSAKADEGMWLPLFIERLNYTDMQEKGLKLTAEEIYSINHSSLKDAVIIFGRGCTGEIVSDKGLIFTNHHCGYGAIQSHSTVEHDYLSDGFWASSLEEEIPTPGLTATFLIRIEDVTGKVQAVLNDEMTEDKRNEEIKKISKQLSDAATEGTHYNASVRSFFAGDEFYLFVYEVFTDVRLVGAPPSSIGKFGADTDNWMWPRHTGDFSIFRIYTSPEGKPAEFAKENIPLKPRHFLPISLDGVQNNDFAMIMGYPGSTDRYLSSWGVELAIKESNPTVVAIRDKKLKIMRQYMDVSDEIRIQYASKYAGTSNYWKYFIGQTRGLKRLKVVDKKRAEEAAFTEWVNANPERRQMYGNALDLRRTAVEKKREYNLTSIYMNEAISRGSEILMFSRRFSKLSELLQEKNPDNAAVDKEVKKLRESVAGFFKNYHAPLDKELLGAMLEMYYNNVPASNQPELLNEIHKKYKGDFAAYAEAVFAKTKFASLTNVNKLLDKPSAKAIDKDPVTVLAKAFADLQSKFEPLQVEVADLAAKGERLYIRGLREMKKNDKVFYPDANFTMRLTYGTISDYYPADAVHYDYITTLTGVMEKEDPSNWEFEVPEKLKELYRQKDYGMYGQDGEMIVAFISNNDITGGNSGSPVMNGNGELIGIAFDGNWEAMSGDIAFEPELQRTISVDIRYVLFIIDKFAGAKNLIDELTIVPKKSSQSFKIKTDIMMETEDAIQR